MPTPAELKLMQISQKLKEAKEKKETPPPPPVKPSPAPPPKVTTPPAKPRPTSKPPAPISTYTPPPKPPITDILKVKEQLDKEIKEAKEPEPTPPAPSKTPEEFKADLITSGILPEAGAKKISATIPKADVEEEITEAKEPEPTPPALSKTPEEFKAYLITSGILPEAGAKKISATIPKADVEEEITEAKEPEPTPPAPSKTPEEFKAGLIKIGLLSPEPSKVKPPETKEPTAIDPTQYLETKTISEPVQLTPGQTVRVTWEKDGKLTTTMVKAERLADFEERYDARIVKVETYGGKPITFYQVPTTTEYEEAYRQAYVEEYRKTGEVPQWALEQIEIPKEIKQLGLEEQYIKSVYEESIRYKHKAPEGFVGPVAPTGMAAFESVYYHKTMGSKEWVEQHGEFIVDGETKTWEQLKEEEPALYLEYEPGKGYVPKQDIIRWEKEYYEKAGITGVVKKGAFAVLNIFDVDFYSKLATGGFKAAKIHTMQKDYLATIGIEKAQREEDFWAGAKVWAGLQAPAYESVILPLAGGAAFGAAFGTVGKIGSGTLKVTGWGAKTVPKVARVFGKAGAVTLGGTYAVGEGVHIGTSLAESPEKGLSASLRYGTRLGFGLAGARAGYKWATKPKTGTYKYSWSKDKAVPSKEQLKTLKSTGYQETIQYHENKVLRFQTRGIQDGQLVKMRGKQTVVKGKPVIKGKGVIKQATKTLTTRTETMKFFTFKATSKTLKVTGLPKDSSLVLSKAISQNIGLGKPVYSKGVSFVKTGRTGDVTLKMFEPSEGLSIVTGKKFNLLYRGVKLTTTTKTISKVPVSEYIHRGRFQTGDIYGKQIVYGKVATIGQPQPTYSIDYGGLAAKLAVTVKPMVFTAPTTVPTTTPAIVTPTPTYKQTTELKKPTFTTTMPKISYTAKTQKIKLPTGYALAYGVVDIRTLEFLEEGTQYVHPRWERSTPTITKPPTVVPITMKDITQTTKPEIDIAAATGTVGALSHKPMIDISKATDIETAKMTEPKTAAIPIQTPITTPKVAQIQQQQMQQQLQQITIQTPVTIQITPPDTTPPYRPKRFFFPDLPEGIAEKKYIKTKQGYDVYVKDRVYVKGKKKYEDRYKKINVTPLTKENALGLGGTAVDNSAAATFYIKPTQGKISPPSIRISPWSILQHKFRTKDNKKVEYKTFRMDTQGEIQGISALGWISHQRKLTPRSKPRPLPKKKPMKELPELDYLGLEQYSISMDDYNKVINRRFNLGI